MTRITSRAVAVGAALALLATGCRGGSAINAGGGPTNSPGCSPLATASPPQTAVASPGANNQVALDGTARSVETTAALSGLRSVQLAGTSTVTATGEVVDHTGRDLGLGSLQAQGTDVTVSGASLQITSRMRVQPGAVTLNDGSDGTDAPVQVSFAGPATVASAGLTFQPPPPPAPNTPAPPPGSPTTTVPPPVAIAGPVTVRTTDQLLAVAGSDLRLVDPPADLSVSSPEADLSWAGSGSITTAQGPVQAPYLGVRAQQLQATLLRRSGQVDVRGGGRALQVYANGLPQVQVAARIDVLGTGATTGFLERRPAFVWTPRNLDSTYDMAILSIRPANRAACGVSLGLLPMPPMFGGEPHALTGGDTAGLERGDAIDSLIARDGNDKRSIGYNAPSGAPLVLIVQGNFAPITVTVTSP